MTAKRRAELRARTLHPDDWERSEATEKLLVAGEKSFRFWRAIAEDRYELVRYDAARAMARVKHHAVRSFLREWMERERDPGVRQNLWISLAVHDPDWVRAQQCEAIHLPEDHGTMIARCWIGDRRGPAECLDILKRNWSGDTSLSPLISWFEGIEPYSPWARHEQRLAPTRQLSAVARRRVSMAMYERFLGWLLGPIDDPAVRE